MAVRTIADMCSDAVRLKAARDNYLMMARCATDELNIVDEEIAQWSNE